MALDPDKPGWQRCPMSNEVEMLAWLPDDKGYPGAVVCIGCSFGVLIWPGTHHEATSESGNEFYAGTVEPHDVRYEPARTREERQSPSNDPIEMRYTSRRKGGPLWQTKSA
jgi:hypothetical protein